MSASNQRQPRHRLLRVVYRSNLRDSRRAASADQQREQSATTVDAKILAEVRKLSAETIKTYLALVGPITAAAGIITVFLYTFFISHSFPTGLTAGDTILFVFIAMGIVLCSFALSLSGLFIFLPWINRIPNRTGEIAHGQRDVHRKSPPPDPTGFREKILKARFTIASQNANMTVAAIASVVLFAVTISLALGKKLDVSVSWLPDWMLSAIFCFVIAFLAITAFVLSFLVTDKGNRLSVGQPVDRIFVALTPLIPALLFAVFFANLPLGKATQLSLGVFFGSLSFAFALDCLDGHPLETKLAARRRQVSALIFCIASCISPSLVGGMANDLANLVMQRLGLYSVHATILVDGAGLAALQADSLESGQPLYACRINDSWVAVSDVQVWWNSIGTKTYVELPRARTASPMLPVALDSTGVKVAGRSNGVCVETGTGVYFDSDKDTFNNPAQVEHVLHNLFRRVYGDSEPVCQRGDVSDQGTVVITGHADPMSRIAGNNVGLSLHRACQTYQYLRDDLKVLTNKRTLIDVDADTATNDRCATFTNRKDKIGCEESKRYVSVKILTGGSHLEIPGASDADSVCSGH